MRRPYLYLMLLLAAAVSTVHAQHKRPNIIVFIVDDMGWSDSSLPFGRQANVLNERYHTPNMRRLAARGIRFTNAYAAPVCTPSRAAMLSGMSPAHSGITNWTDVNKNTNTDAGDKQFSPADWRVNGLSPQPGVSGTAYAVPFTQLLKNAGYYTIHVGKAHWASAGTPGANPYNMGFMVNVAGNAAGNPQSYLPAENYGNMPGRATARAVQDMQEYYGSNVYLTQALTQEALKAIETPVQRGQPFYLNMAHYAVHVPLQADARFVNKYYAAGLDSAEAAYASMLEGMDYSLGNIMDYLERHNIADNTAIIFISDNGGLALPGERSGRPYSQNVPLKAGKGSVYEGGIRVPMLVSYPPVTKPGGSTAQYVIIEDLFPTVLELAGLRHYAVPQQPDGKSMVPYIKNPHAADSTRTLIWHYPNKWTDTTQPGTNYYSAIRRGPWKLVYSMRTGQAELYNLDSDIGEEYNVAGANPTRVKEMLKLLSAKLKGWKAPMPISRATGRPAPWPGEQVE